MLSTRMADRTSPEALSLFTSQPIEQLRPAAGERYRIERSDFALLDPDLAKLIEDNKVNYQSTVAEMYSDVARQMAAGAIAVIVTVGGRPAWRFWPDGRVDDLPIDAPNWG